MVGMKALFSIDLCLFSLSDFYCSLLTPYLEKITAQKSRSDNNHEVAAYKKSFSYDLLYGVFNLCFYTMDSFSRL